MSILGWIVVGFIAGALARYSWRSWGRCSYCWCSKPSAATAAGDTPQVPGRRRPRPPSTSVNVMNEVVIVEAVRTPIGRRNGGLSTLHPADLLGTVLLEVVGRSGIDPAEVEQVVAGCVSQVGEQSFNVARTARLSAGLPLSTAATTVDTQCGSSQQATNV